MPWALKEFKSCVEEFGYFSNLLKKPTVRLRIMVKANLHFTKS